MLTPDQTAAWQTTYNLSYYVLLGALFVSFVATGLTFIANNRISDDLTERLTQTTASAGQANERAARLEKEASIAKAQQTEAEKHIVEMNLEILNIKKPRYLDINQSQELVQILSSYRGTEFDLAITPGGVEPEQLLTQIESILKQSEWSQKPWSSGSAIVFSRVDKSNVGVSNVSGVIAVYQLSERDRFEGPANNLVYALNKMGIAAAVSAEEWKSVDEGGNGPNKGVLHIYVGSKPI